MAYTQVKIDDILHEKMKQFAGQSNNSVVEEYRTAIKFYIEYQAKENLIADSRLESFINERIGKMENRLASMMGRTGMDTSMVLMGLLLFLEKYFNGKITREQLQEKLRTDGARYFSTAIKSDKDKKKND